MKPGSWQRQESPVKWMSGQQNLGSWNEFWQVNMSELGLVCTSTQSQPFHLDLDSVALIGPGGVKGLDRWHKEGATTLHFSEGQH